jgi:hypothetical protein
MSNVITKFYKIINPESAKVSVEDSHDLVGNYGMYGNYSWFNKLIQGSESRQQRYREYDMMDNDTDMQRALDIYAQEITGNNPKSDLPIRIEVTTGNEQSVSATTLTTLQAALRTWVKIHEWDLYLRPLIRNTIKYGDAFFMRNKSQKNKWQWIHPKNVTGAIVTADNMTKVKAWQIKTDFTDARDDYNTTSGLIDNNNTYNIKIYKADEIVHFGLHDNLSDEAPFSRSVFTNVYTTFKQKQMLEDAVLIYRIVRAPEKRVFKVEVGNMPAPARAQYLNNFKNEIKQKKIPTPNGGSNQVESIYSPIAQNEDIFLTQKDGKGTTIETLPGGQGLGELTEVQYFYQKIWRGLGIPQSYIDNTTEGGTPINDGKVGIAYMQELQFILRIEQLQLHFEKTLDYEFKRFLHENNIMADETQFKVILPEPSNYKKSRDNAINNDLVALMGNAMSNIPFLSGRYAAKKYLGWTESDILENYMLRCEELGLDPNDRRNMAKVYNPDQADSGGYDGGMTDGTGLSGFSDGDGSDSDNESGTDDGTATNSNSKSSGSNNQNQNTKNTKK